MTAANIQGYFTNHSLRVTAATTMYDARLDEATTIGRTGHQSVARWCEGLQADNQ